MSVDIVTVTLAEDEQEKIRRRKRTPRPSYFDAVSGEDVEITADFEAFLILLPSPVKIAIVKYIERITKDSSFRRDRDELMAEFLADDLVQAESMLDELKSEIQVYSDFRSEYDVGKFGGVDEVSILTKDLSLGMPESVEAFDGVTYHATHIDIVNQRFENGFWGSSPNANQKKQTQSWLRCLLAYL